MALDRRQLATSHKVQPSFEYLNFTECLAQLYDRKYQLKAAICSYHTNIYECRQGTVQYM